MYGVGLIMSMPTARLSSALLVADVNDFLTPSESCVLPMSGGLQAEPAGSVLAPIIPSPAIQTGTSDSSESARPAAKASITLSDCLSCSGCVTTAETVLLSSTSVELLRSVMQEADMSTRRAQYAVAALSQQAVASIATRAGLSLQSCARKLSHFLRTSLHFDAVVDLSLARQLSLAECAAEFISRHRSGAPVTVCSACPGWLAYAEKTLDKPILDAMSTVRSPQAVVAALARAMLAPDDSRTVWLATVMPCHDKKIEASRPEYALENGNREVDCVITTGELLDLIDEMKYDLCGGEESDLVADFSVREGEFGTGNGGGSGGYAEYVLRIAAKEILSVELPPERLVFEKASRSGDMRSIEVSSKDSSKKLRFALAYGFRSLQSILRKMRKGLCPYDYIELMACPGGCNNGGGQLPLIVPDGVKLDDAKAVKAANSSLLKSVEANYFSAPQTTLDECHNRAGEVYKRVVQGDIGCDSAVKMLHTTIVSRKKTNIITPNSLAW